MSIRPQAEYEALQKLRQEVQTEAFKSKYRKRAGIEGTISQAVRAYDFRRARYIGLAKVHLQQVATAAAINLARLIASGAASAYPAIVASSATAGNELPVGPVETWLRR